jgi:hypothetical protein
MIYIIIIIFIVLYALLASDALIYGRKKWKIFLTFFLFCGIASADTFDVAIIGDDYISQTNFQSDAEKVAAKIISFDPISQYAVNFILAWNQDDLYCAPSASMSRLVTCSESVVRNKLTALGIVADKTIVIWNNPQYGGSGGSLTVVSNGQQMEGVAIHEFAHSAFGLVDEYVLYGTNGTERDAPLANCWQMTKAGWFRGCNYPNYYRQTDCSIMRDLGCNYFNQVSKDWLIKRLNIYTGYPNVTLTAFPLEGRAPLTVVFNVEVTGNAPFSYTWNF